MPAAKPQLLAPWATPPVDRLLCALDAQNLPPRAIVKRLKIAFPSLRHCVVTVDMVERRLRVLDQDIEVDYFKHGLPGGWVYVPGSLRVGTASTDGSGAESVIGRVESGLEMSRGVKHGVKIHAGHGEAWEVKPLAPQGVIRGKSWYGWMGNGGKKSGKGEKGRKESFAMQAPLGMGAPAAALGAKRSWTNTAR